MVDALRLTEADASLVTRRGTSFVLVLLSFGLVLVATVLLVLGLLADGGLNLIYVSIVLSLAAGIVLVLATRVARPREPALAGGPAPLVPDQTMAHRAVATAPLTATLPTVPARAEQGGASEWLADDGWEPAAPAREAAVLGEWAEDEEELEFPIADYDELTVAELMPLLPQLYSDELDVVEDRERSGKARSTILNELARLRGATGAAPHEPLDEELEPEPARRVPAPVVAAVDDDVDWDDDDDEFFPIEDYDELTAAEIVSVLGELDEDELRQVREHEATTQVRRTVLTNIDRRLGAAAPVRRPVVVRPAPPSRSRPPATTAAARARKAPGPTNAAQSANRSARTRTTKKAASPAKQSAPARKPSPAKTAAAANKAPAKATTRRATSPAKGTTPAKKR